MRIALCLIVKDELPFLDQCVASVRGLVDQVVIVDTGSTDGTVERARALADVFVEYPFDDDFSAARNAALERAEGDWVVFLDADERLPANAVEPLRHTLAAAGDDVLGCRLMRYNFFATGSFYSGRELRVFRNLPQVRYRRRINESVADAIRDAGGRVEAAPVLLNHFGHCRPVDARERKAHRYLALMAEQLRQQPDDGVLVGYLGLIERTFGNFSTALRHSEEAVRIAPDRATVWLFRGHVLRSVGDDVGALGAYQRATALAPTSAAGHNMVGVQRHVLGDLDEAARAYETARRCDPQLVHVDVNLGLLAQSQENWTEAVTLFRRAGRANPAFFDDRWHGRVERDPYRPFYNETVFGYAGLGYHLGYCQLRADDAIELSAAQQLEGTWSSTGSYR
ncbi:glycosyltransferase [Micromonospora sp. WMMD1102]|uniref:glycosyltransferase n=1 Tax=Micromonospora sp. WMMD1102 TaxID=3016105 RepID=UPI0024157CB9|nr:TPR domain-containing glycosyltransferase [Micromonospora sp. WMMD1102]MDG4788035.1 glycosyltransferase [Micromonospora sp. WMMD1102]